MHGGVRSVNGP